MYTSRRKFIKTTGCLTIGFSWGGALLGCTSSPSQAKASPHAGDDSTIDAWLQVSADGRVRVLTGKMELGQGISTAIAQVAAEELNLHMEDVTLHLAETGVTPNEGYTAGSGSIERSAMSVRYAAAYARQRLLELAAAHLKVPVEKLDTARGEIYTSAGNPRVSFAELLAGKQLEDTIPARDQISLKPKDRYSLVGKPVSRNDISQMVRANPVYVQNLRFPGMVHARTVRPPVYHATLQQVDQQAVMNEIPGILKIVVNGSFLGVIAKEEHAAIQAQKLLSDQSRWSYPPPFPQQAIHDLKSYLRGLSTQTEEVVSRGDHKSPSEGPMSLKASYFKPYIMHGSTGPSCAIALFESEKLKVWSHSQGVYPLRDTLAKMLHLPAEDIQVKGVPGSGCYGHNGADDAAADAALMAMAYPGKAVRLQWSREEEHRWEPYGSAMIMEISAQLDSSGRITHWQHDLWSDSHGSRPGGRPGNLLPARHLADPFPQEQGGFSGGAHRNSEPYYRIPNLQVHAHAFKGPLRTSSLRSLGAYANLFAIESFMDELAEKAGKDPYQFRLMHLQDERAIAVIQRIKALTEGQGLPGTGMGLAFSRYENTKTYVAVVARVSVNRTQGKVAVQKMWAVVDSGETINPDGLKNQIEGGMIQSASWTLKEQVKFDDKHIISHDWNTYPILRFEDVPEVEVVVLDHPSEKALGAGEAAQGPAAAAIVNAIYRVTKTRIRHLPVEEALKA
jgi:CO/xanthine dehydrogenase Mo-binding subunit